MPYIQGRHGGRAALTEVAIIDAARHREHRQSQKPVLDGVRPYIALIDTGATSTMITSVVVDDLKLQPVSKLPFHGVDGLTWKMAYLFHVAFYGAIGNDGLQLDDGDRHRVGTENPVSRIHVCARPITGGEINSAPSFHVLLSMDIITTGVLRIDNQGGFRFSF